MDGSLQASRLSASAFPVASLRDFAPLSGAVAQDHQATLRDVIDCRGHGVHSGVKVHLRLCPAPADTGIVFRRRDLGQTIPARFDHVVDTSLCTVLGLAGSLTARVGTVEHLMAALAGAGVDNAIVEMDGPEAPILDGSAEPFQFLIDCAGLQDQGLPRRRIQILKPVRVRQGEAWVELLPATEAPAALQLSLSIDFAAAAIGRQAWSLTLSPASFRTELARARTFGMAEDIAALQARGLALGGSLENAVVVQGDHVLNPGGLRSPDEFVRHKLLDAVGDLALAGAPLCGRYVGHRAGHRLNNMVLRALFADAANWRETYAPLAASWGGPRIAAA